jgi:maleate isomerase
MTETMQHRTLIGMLTPSSNTILEKLVTAMLHDLPDVSAHFSRLPVTEISLEAAAVGQFDTAPMLAAARLLADAKVAAICWNGSSAGWLGLDRDVALCADIVAETGIAACSSVLALNEAFQRSGVRRFGLVTPYLDNVQAQIIATYAAAGFVCVAERHLGQRGNFGFSEVPPAEIANLCRAVAREAGLDGITIFCTNLNGAGLVPALEAELGIPIYDTVATALWKSMLVAGADPARIGGWGSLFQLKP